MDPYCDLHLSRSHDLLESEMLRAESAFNEARLRGNDITAEREWRVLKYYLVLVEAEDTVRLAFEMAARRPEDDNISWDKAFDGALGSLNRRRFG